MKSARFGRAAPAPDAPVCRGFAQRRPEVDMRVRRNLCLSPLFLGISLALRKIGIFFLHHARARALAQHEQGMSRFRTGILAPLLLLGALAAPAAATAEKLSPATGSTPSRRR